VYYIPVQHWFSSLVLPSLEWESIHRFLVNPNPLALMKIGASIFHFLPHFPFYLHFVHFEKAENEFFFLATTL
jgi:hypothetical protein